MACELGRRGAKVIVNYANSDVAAQEVVSIIKKAGSEAVAIKGNVSVVSDIINLFDQAKKQWGKLDIVCSNSGVVTFGHIKDVTEEEYDRVMNINTRGQFFVAREAYKNLEVGGRLIMMGSITGQAKGVPAHTVYSGSKGAIETFVRCMAIGNASIYHSPRENTLLTIPRLRRQENHRKLHCSRWNPHRHVPQSLPRIYSQRCQPQRRRSRRVCCYLVPTPQSWSPNRYCQSRLLLGKSRWRVGQWKGYWY